MKRFAVHDGPGIRTTVFLKGCPLRCAWCHNPESQRATPELFFRRSRCVGCAACAAVCPTGAVRVADGVAGTDRAACTGCGLCVRACPHRARSLAGRAYTVPELMAEIERDLLFYDESGGGLTLSGGEPLAQPEFALALLREARARGISTALDTSGHAAPELIEEASIDVGLFLYDLKLAEGGRHAAATGVGNDLILDNASRLGRLGARMWIRFPLVPGFNDDEENVAAVGRLVGALRSVEAIQVLPYHRTGEGKRDRLERASGMREVEPPSPENVERVASILRREARLPVTIGG